MEHELPKTLTAEHRELVNDLFDWLIEPSMYYITHSCKFLINTSESHLVFTLMRLYTCQLDEIIEDGKHSETEEGEEAPASLLSPSQVGQLSCCFFNNSKMKI